MRSGAGRDPAELAPQVEGGNVHKTLVDEWDKEIIL